MSSSKQLEDHQIFKLKIWVFLILILGSIILTISPIQVLVKINDINVQPIIFIIFLRLYIL